jgi:glycogen(starch) synthase
MPSTSEPRILWITERYPPLGGGMAVSCARQVDELRRLGLPLDVIAFTDSEPGAAVRTIPRDGGSDWHFSLAPQRGLTARRAWHLTDIEHKRRSYTFVVGFGAGLPGYLASTFAAWLGCPSLVLARGNDFDTDWFDPHRGAWVREALSRATTIGAVSPEMADRIRALYPAGTVLFVPNGVDPRSLKLLPSDDRVRDEVRERLVDNGQKVIGLFGELKEKKGVPLWLGALRDTGLMDRAGLLFVGKWIDAEISQILEDPVLAPRNIHIPFSSRDKLPGLYGACDFVAVPSLFDGMPNVLLEAMALEVVPIVSDAGAMAQMVADGETGFVFQAGDRRAAAEATARALRLSESERKAMGKRAGEYVLANYSMDKEAETLKRILLGTDA